MTQRIIIIGGGPAGYEAALVAAQYGADVTIVDADGIGGNCVLSDCVPSKTFIATTGVRTDMRRAEEMGVQAHFDPTAYKLGQVNGRVKSLARAQSADIRAQLQREGVRLISGWARLHDSQPGMASHRVAVTFENGQEKIFDADVVLMATGSSPRVLRGAEPDGERILNWRQLYDSPSCPPTWS